MPLGRDRTRQGVRGLGNLEVLEKSPTPDTDFQNVGILDVDGTDFTEQVDVVERKDENGRLTDVLERGRGTLLATNLAQVGKDEMDLVRDAYGKLYGIRYYGQSDETGRFQFYAMEQAKLDPSLARKYVAEKQALPFKAFALHQDEFTLGYTIPDYYLAEFSKPLPVYGLKLGIFPHLGDLANSALKVLDVSGWGRHGASYNSVTRGDIYLRYDGVSKYTSFGDTLDDDGISDFAINFWLRPQAADGTAIYGILAKMASNASGPGFNFQRGTGNTLSCALHDGTSPVLISSISNGFTQNVWKFCSLVVDRNGNATLYINGAQDCTPLSVAALGSMANSLSLRAGANTAQYGQVDIGAFLHYTWPAGTVGTKVSGATLASQIFTATRGIYGV